MLVRYFAAACAAAGVQEEHFDLPEGTTFEELIAAILAVERIDGYSAGTPSLAGVIPQCSFLRNEVALRTALRPSVWGMSSTSCRRSRADSASATRSRPVDETRTDHFPGHHSRGQVCQSAAMLSALRARLCAKQVASSYMTR